MKVILAGYNVDSSVIDDLKKNSPSLQNVTPETMSAAYARISRDPRSVDALRAVARSEVEQNYHFQNGTPFCSRTRCL